MGMWSTGFKGILGLRVGLGVVAGAMAQTVPNAPPTPICAMREGHSDCRFKAAMSGTPTSVVGNRVIVFRYSKSGGHGISRIYLDSAVSRLSQRYGFTATITEDPAIFTAANLANTKVVIMSNGDGDVVPPGANRMALESFQHVNGWGMIWIHSACSFITSGWPFGQQSCVQQYFHHNSSGTPRRIFLDSGTADVPDQGIRNPQSEFMLRSLPGWGNSRAFALTDEFHCFQAPARKTEGVNVLLGYDHGSGLSVSGCPEYSDSSEAASQSHNLAWTHAMGNGIAIVNSIGHDEDTYTAGSHMGDSLLWRFIRYAAKDWEVPASNVFAARARVLPGLSVSGLSLALTFADPGPNAVTVSDLSGQRVFARIYAGVGQADIPDLKRGIYFVRVVSKARQAGQRVRVL